MRDPQYNNITIEQYNNRKRGFTFIELIIVTAIISVVALAIYATLNNGIKIWQKVNRQLPEEDLNIFLDKFSLDIRNTFKFTGINFSGTIEKVEFPTLVKSPRLQKRTVGKLIYAYEPQNRILNRQQIDFSAVYSGEDTPVQHSLKNVKSLRYQYYFYDKERKEYLWQDEWSNEDLPLAVKLELEFDDEKEIKKFIKTVSIPTGS